MEKLISLFIFLFLSHLPVANSVRCSAIKASDGGTISYMNCYTCIETQCLNCEPGYSNLATCTRCAAGTYSTGGTALCQNCPAGTYSYAESGSCTNCPGGTYSPAAASSGCTSCLPGQYSMSSLAATGCASCPAGKYLPSAGSSASDCLLCPSGSYSPLGSPSCISCSAGQYSSAGSGGCSTCTAGKYSSSGSGSCLTCPKGTYSRAGAGSCTTCSAGTYSDAGSGKCSQCPAGSWSNGGTDSCVQCIAGTYSPFPGATSSADCLSCPAGQYSIQGAALCESCDAGLFSNGGASSCTVCPAGTYSPLLGGSFSSCKLCSEGYYSKEGALTCEVCPPGTYSFAGASECISCPFGQSSYAGASSCFATSESYLTDVTQISMNVISKFGSSVCIGSSMFVTVGLIMKIVQNMRFMEIGVSRELNYAFHSWENNVLAWDPPESFGDHSGSLPYVFAQYEMKSNFLVNYWSYLVIILIGLGCVVLFKLLKYFFAEQLKERKIVSAVLKFFISAACNFTVVQIYNSLDSVVFYSILDLRFSRFSSSFSRTSSILGIGFSIFAVGMILLNMWIIYKYIQLKREGTQILENFIKKFEILQVVYKDLKDDGGFKLSFFAIMIVRAMISSLIMVVFYSNPLLQAILLMIINVLMLAILILTSPFKELYDELAQYFYELIIFIAYLCVLLTAIADKRNKEAFHMRENIGKCIIALNTILLAGTIAFMCIEIYKKIIEIYEAWKETQTNKEMQQQSETTRQFLTQERGMTDISFNQNNHLLETFKRSFSTKKSQIFPMSLSQSSHLTLSRSDLKTPPPKGLNLQPWEPKDEVIFGEDRRQIREGSPQDANTSVSSRRYVRKIPNKIHPDLSSSEEKSASYYFKSNYKNDEAETQNRKSEKSSSNLRSFAETSLNGPFNYSANYNPQLERKTVESIHEERIENQVTMTSEGRKLKKKNGNKRRVIKQLPMIEVDNDHSQSELNRG